MVVLITIGSLRMLAHGLGFDARREGMLRDVTAVIADLCVEKGAYISIGNKRRYGIRVGGGVGG